MTVEERMDKIEKALGANDPLVRELRDAVTVTAQMEARQSRARKEHTEWLAEHEIAMREHDARMCEHDARMKTLNERMRRPSD